MIVDIAFVSLGEDDVRTEFVYRNSFAGLGFGLSCLIENQIGRFFAAVEEGAPLDPWLDRDFGGMAYRKTEAAPQSAPAW